MDGAGEIKVREQGKGVLLVATQMNPGQWR